MFSSNSVPKNIDLDFIYADCDSHANEISELYSYTEEDDFFENRKCFEQLIKDLKLSTNKWSDMNDEQRNCIIDKLANTIELSDRLERTKSVRSTLYLLQGLFGECLQIDNQMLWTNQIVITLYKKEFFQMFVQLLLMEIDFSMSNENEIVNNPPKSLKDSLDLRLILNALYIFVEVMLRENEKDNEEEIKIKKQFKDDLSNPLAVTNELLATTLFQMTTKFCNGKAPHFPIKKVLLLLWKVLMLTLGGIEELKRLKQIYRDNANLKPFQEDPNEIIKTIRPSTPPSPENGRIGHKYYINKVKKMSSFRRQVSILNFSDKGDRDEVDDEIADEAGSDESDVVSVNSDSNLNVDEDDVLEDGNDESNDGSKKSSNDGLDLIIKEMVEDLFNLPQDTQQHTGANNENSNQNNNKNENGEIDTPRPGSPRLEFSSNESKVVNPNVNKDEMQSSQQTVTFNKGLPWRPKVRTKDIDIFFDQVRRKNIGFLLANDRTTTAGLPQLTIDSIKILNQYLYVSLAEQQIQREEDLALYPLTYKELDSSSLDSSAERLYKEMLPSLPQYMIALLKILFASIPTSKNKTEVFNIMCEVMTEEENMNFLESMKYMIDVNRHKEIIIKAVSSILLLILKHYKINHIYQFEYISQQLMLANCIPLILKFFNQNVLEYITSKNTITVIDFPACVIGEQAELSNEILEMGYAETPYCWRNLFSSINLLRILNKLIKWKETRIQALNFFKAYPILRKALLVRHSTMQLYVLKLIKMQVRHFGRQWRKTNIQTISIIYQKVRHRFTDDWVYSNASGNKPTIMNNFQKEELNLQAKIKSFHIRRYNTKDLFGETNEHTNSNLITNENLHQFIGLSGEENLDDLLLSTTDKEIILTDDFKDNYENWLEKEVFQNSIDWNLILDRMEGGDDFD